MSASFFFLFWGFWGSMHSNTPFPVILARVPTFEETNRVASIVSAAMFDRRSPEIYSAEDQLRSEGAAVIGTGKRMSASFCSRGHCSPYCFHHCTRSVSRCTLWEAVSNQLFASCEAVTCWLEVFCFPLQPATVRASKASALDVCSSAPWPASRTRFHRFT